MTARCERRAARDRGERPPARYHPDRLHPARSLKHRVTSLQIEATAKLAELAPAGVESMSRAKRSEVLEGLYAKERPEYWLALQVQVDLAKTRSDLLTLLWEHHQYPGTASELNATIANAIRQRQQRAAEVGKALGHWPIRSHRRGSIRCESWRGTSLARHRPDRRAAALTWRPRLPGPTKIRTPFRGPCSGQARALRPLAPCPLPEAASRTLPDPAPRSGHSLILCDWLRTGIRGWPESPGGFSRPAIPALCYRLLEPDPDLVGVRVVRVGIPRRQDRAVIERRRGGGTPIGRCVRANRDEHSLLGRVH